MIASWLFAEPFWHWLVHVLLETVTGFLLISSLVAPLFLKAKRKILDLFNPDTPGGLGDLDDGGGGKRRYERAAHTTATAPAVRGR